MHIKDWLPPMIKRWASQKKRATSGLKRYADGTIHEDGWAPSSSAALALEGKITHGSGPRGQHYDEVYTGDGLRIWRIYKDSPIEVRDILDAHFVKPGTANRKARDMNIALSSYWKQLDCAYYFSAGYLNGAAAQRAQNALKKKQQETV